MRRTLLMAAAIVLAFTAIGSPRARAAAVIVYVDANAPGPTHDGDSWATAYTTVIAGLADADIDGDGDQVWVADGTYFPGLNRANHFSLANGLAIYGGFSGNETQLSQRDLAANPTILSGAIDTGADNDNSYHVVIAQGVNNTAILDGFIIEKAYSTSTDPLPGGGLYVDGNATLRNLELRDNRADESSGGGAYVNSGTPSFESVTFSGNTTSASGAGVFVAGGTTDLANVTFADNFATTDGGAVATTTGVVTINNATFFGNFGNGDGDAIYATGNNANVTVTNSILVDLDDGAELKAGTGTNLEIEVSDSLVEGTCAGTDITCSDIVTGNPLLGALFDNGGQTRTIPVAENSPAIDAGDDATCETLDQRGQTRVDGDFNGSTHCDLGAFEFSTPRVSFDSTTSSRAESATGSAIPVSLSNATLGDVTVDYFVSDVTAVGGTDYNVASGTLTFPEGGPTTQSIAVDLVNDPTDEADESFLVSLGTVTNGSLGMNTSHTATISDDDAPPKVRFEPATSKAGEGRAVRNMKVSLSLASSKEVTVKLATSGGTATGGGVDYTFDPTTITFAPGETEKTVSASVVDDFFVEGKETFAIALSDPTNATLGNAKKHIGAITDNDNGSCDGKNATIAGTGGNDVLTGTNGPDVIDGKGGNDTIRGRGTDDLICGGPGDDRLIGSGGKDRILGGRGDDEISGRAGGDAVLGGPGDDSVDGGPGRDTIQGGNGADALKGGNGRDELRGEGGGDSLEGGPGDGDVCDGGPGADSLTAVHGCETVAGVP